MITLILTLCLQCYGLVFGLLGTPRVYSVVCHLRITVPLSTHCSYIISQTHMTALTYHRLIAPIMIRSLTNQDAPAATHRIVLTFHPCVSTVKEIAMYVNVHNE